MTNSHQRLQTLLYELEHRFPEVEVTDPEAEAKYLAEIDRLLSQAPKLTHHVVLESWEHVCRVLKFFKRKSQAGFCIELEEEPIVPKLQGSKLQYRVKIYRI